MKRAGFFESGERITESCEENKDENDHEARAGPHHGDRTNSTCSSAFDHLFSVSGKAVLFLRINPELS